MKQTNYHLFDFMDFSDFRPEGDTKNNPSQQKHEALWKAYAPTKVEEVDGDIVITIPYQKQLRQEDMAPDTAVPQQSFDLVLRAYEPNILRLFTTMSDDEKVEQDDMLLFAPEVKRLPLTVQSFPEGSIGCNIIAANGKKLATIDLNAPVLDHWSDLLPAPQPAPFITFYPDGDETKGIALSDDHFSPPRYDALPLGFCSVGSCGTATNPTSTERATISFKCEPDE